MTLQIIRAAIEQPIIAAFASVSPAIPVYVENQEYGDKGSEDEFALVSLQWGLTTEPAIGCKPGELIRGVLTVELFTAKGDGPGRAQAAITPALQALRDLGGMATSGVFVSLAQIRGPSFTPLDLMPHLMTRLSVGVRARYDVG